MKRVCLLLIGLIGCLAASGQTALGQWKDWASFNSVYHVAAAGERIYAAGSLGLFYYDRTGHTIETLTKSEGLSDVGIADLYYDETSGWLIVAYTNSNIDLVKDGRVYNVSDIKRAEIPGDKTLYRAAFHNRNAYLACGFGIVVVDLERKEIKESYYLGEGGSYMPIYDILFKDGLIVAATDDGLISAPDDDPMLNVRDRWTQESSILSTMKVRRLALKGEELAVLTDNGAEDVLYVGSDGVYDAFLSGRILDIRNTQGRLCVCQPDRIKIYGGSTDEEITQIGWYNAGTAAAVLDEEGALWAGHEWAGLVKIGPDRDEAEWYRPECPTMDQAYSLKAFRDRMLVAPGGRTTTYANSGITGNVLIYQDKSWHQIDADGHHFVDVLDMAVNPKDTSEILAASWEEGIVRIQEGKVSKIYDQTNTNGALTPYVSGSYSTYRTGAVCFDKQGNAWMTNALVPQGLVKRSRSDEWTSFNIGSMVGGSPIDHILVDDRTGFLWMLGRANRLYVHDGENRMAYVDPNNGSRLNTSSVNCMEMDLDGEIWLGTDKGIKVIYNTSNVFNNGGHGETAPTTCSNIIMSDEFDEYLMHYENITCMAVDGANRKWVGTNTGGLYLISANGQEQISHFTASNSPLYSNKIVCVEVQPKTGEVFIGTDIGLQAYRGTATEGASYINKDNIYAFPNPVKPEYEGPVAIKGFSTNALVHITDAAGHVVFSTNAEGGQAIWNTYTNNGEKVGSGVYYVFASDTQGQMRAVTKVLIIR